MSLEKPKTLDDYKKWLNEVHGLKITNRERNYYDQVATKVKDSFENSSFWADFTHNLQEYNDEYALSKHYPLLVETSAKLQIKNWNSFLDKSFRKNVIFNKNWPDEPNGGWILEHNWFSRIDDVVRTLIVVKYLDGVDFIIKKIESLGVLKGFNTRKRLEARDDGYYAAHVYVKGEFEIPKKDWDTEKKEFSIEIQITTQLQEVIRKLLHNYYEDKRSLSKDGDAWKWDYQSNRFAASYLGHMLHYIEGLIVQTRERQIVDRVA